MFLIINNILLMRNPNKNVVYDFNFHLTFSKMYSPCLIVLLSCFCQLLLLQMYDIVNQC